MKKTFLAALFACILSGCTTTAPFSPASGLIYTNTKAPLQLEYNNTQLGHKVGTATSNSILGLFAFGDNSVNAAAKDGGIKIVKHVDYEFTNVFFGAFTKTVVYVYGD